MSVLLPILQKPKQGEPCNRCGKCCRDELCPIALTSFPGHDPWSQCPALEVEASGEFACGMLKRPAFYMNLSWQEGDREECRKFMAPLFEQILGIGKGCQMADSDQEEGKP